MSSNGRLRLMNSLSLERSPVKSSQSLPLANTKIPRVGRPQETKIVLPGKVKPKDGKVMLNGHSLKTLEALGAHQPKLEFLYLRNNYLRNFQGLGYMPQLRVLDVTSNVLESLEFLGVLPNLRELYLNANMLTTLSDLPTMPCLEVLSVCQNEIDLLRFMQPQPELRALFVSHNHIATLDGFPACPKIESIRTLGNPLEQHEQWRLTVMVVCGPTLRKINGELLTDEELEDASRYSAAMAMAVRYGAMIGDGDPQQYLLELQKRECMDSRMPLIKAEILGAAQEGCELVAVFSFLFEGETLEDVADGPDDIHGVFYDFQWFRGDRAGNFTEIQNAARKHYVATAEDVGCSLKVEVTPITDLRREEFGATVFAVTSIIAPAMPEAVSCTIAGNLAEGETVSARTVYRGGEEGDSQFMWFRCPPNGSPELIAGGNGPSYTLRTEDVDCTLRVEYTPVREDGVHGEPIIGRSGPVAPGIPTVREVEVEGDVAEDCPLIGRGRYSGGFEGDSLFQWYRSERNSNQVFEAIPGAVGIQYIPTAGEVDRLLKFEYTPVGRNGDMGLPSSFITRPVRPSPPTVTGLRIEGPCEEAAPLRIAAQYRGGTEGRSQVTWYRRLDGDTRWEAMPEVHSRMYVPTLHDVGFFFRVDYLPARSDGKLGSIRSAETRDPIIACAPSVLDMVVTGECVEGGELAAAVTYLGGHEGVSSCAWYRAMDDRQETFELIEGTENQMRYVPGRDDVGRVLKFKFIPVRDDNVQGEAGVFRTRPIGMASPQITRGSLVGEMVEGGVLSINAQYCGGIEGPTRRRWFKVWNGRRTKIGADNATEYVLTRDDVGAEIVCEIVPVRIDGVEGPKVIARTVGAVSAGDPTIHGLSVDGVCQQDHTLTVVGEFSGGEPGEHVIKWYRFLPEMPTLAAHVHTGATYAIQPADIDNALRVDFVPVRSDGIAGRMESYTTPVIKPRDPKLTNVRWAQPDSRVPGRGSGESPREGEGLSIDGDYDGGRPGEHQYNWMRVRGDVKETVSQERVYTPTVDDVGCYLVCVVTPKRSDGILGADETVATAKPVEAAEPKGSAVRVVVRDPNDPLSSRVGSATYYGGREGLSRWQWLRVAPGGRPVEIAGATDREYQPTRADYGCQLILRYTPVRIDGRAGAAVDSSAMAAIALGPPKVNSVRIDGTPQEFEELTVVAEFSENASLPNCRYVWRRSGDEQVTANAADPRRYSPAVTDIDHIIECEVTPVDASGVAGEPAVARTASRVQAGLPRVTDLVIKAQSPDGRPYHNTAFQVHGKYGGGKMGEAEISWYRVGRDGVAVRIPGASRSLYQANADDHETTLKLTYKPTRSDGVQGQQQEASIGPVLLSREAEEKARRGLEQGEVTWQVKELKANNVEEARVLLLNREKIKIQRPPPKGKTVDKARYGKATQVILNTTEPNSTTGFQLQLDNGHTYRLVAQNKDDRDDIALAIRWRVSNADPTAGGRKLCAKG